MIFIVKHTIQIEASRPLSGIRHLSCPAFSTMPGNKSANEWSVPAAELMANFSSNETAIAEPAVGEQ